MKRSEAHKKLEELLPDIKRFAPPVDVRAVDEIIDALATRKDDDAKYIINNHVRYLSGVIEQVGYYEQNRVAKELVRQAIEVCKDYVNENKT